MSEAKPESGEKKPKKSNKLMLIVIAVLLLGGAGGGFFWWKGQQEAKAAEKEKSSKKKDVAKEGEHADAEEGEGHGSADAEEEEEEEEEAHAEAEGTGVLPFEPFIVNLADPGGTRYLKADIRLLVTGVENLKELEEDQAVMMRLRSSILEHLSLQISDQVVTPEGKAALKKEIRKRTAKILKGHGKVADVLFAEFVVQF